MQYRKFGSTTLSTSLLGFGCMRLPILDGDPGKINEPEAIRMIRHAIDLGVNYVDTAYPYHKGQSELLTGKALKDGYREKVYLATKLPTWLLKEPSDTEKYLEEQLGKLETNCIDLYLVHALNKDTWKKAQELKVLESLENARTQGKIRYIGFSFHDQYPVYEDILNAYPWDFCQIQLNYMDEDYQAGLKGMYRAAEKGIAVVIMEPLRGGRLTGNIPEEVKQLWNSTGVKRTPASWALRYLANYREVAVILSGMSTMEQVQENIEILSEATPNSLTAGELEVISRVKDVYRSRMKVMCTECGYCLPCPEGVAIPSIFSIYNDASIYAALQDMQRWYGSMLERKKDASLCVECGQCITACPQGIEIISHLKDAHALLTPK